MGGGGGANTLGRFIGVRDHFRLSFICRWLCEFTRSETAVTQISFYGIILTTNGTALAKKMLRVYGAKFFEYHFRLLVPSGRTQIS